MTQSTSHLFLRIHSTTKASWFTCHWACIELRERDGDGHRRGENNGEKM